MIKLLQFYKKKTKKPKTNTKALDRQNIINFNANIQ